MRSAEKAKLAPCLKKLVPILQQSQVDLTRDPEPAIKLILQLVDVYKTGWGVGVSRRVWLGLHCADTGGAWRCGMVVA